MKTTLGYIANIQTGIFAKPVSKGEIVYLQAKHFNENGQLHSILHPDLKAGNITEKHLLRHGDVLFAAKGTKNFATWYESLPSGQAGKNQPSVASTSFFVIRVQENFGNKILPEFLVWLINHPISQKFLKGKAIGTSIVSISKSVLEELEISIPDLQTQKAILKINQLHNTEKNLKQQIEILREKILQYQLIKGAEDGRRKTEGGRRKAEDGRRKTEGRRRKTGDGRRKTEGGRRKTGDGRQETKKDGRQETEGRRRKKDGRQETEERRKAGDGRKTEGRRRKTDGRQNINS